MRPPPKSGLPLSLRLATALLRGAAGAGALLVMPTASVGRGTWESGPTEVAAKTRSGKERYLAQQCSLASLASRVSTGTSIAETNLNIEWDPRTGVVHAQRASASARAVLQCTGSCTLRH